MRTYSTLDRLLIQFDQGLRTSFAPAPGAAHYPAEGVADGPLDEAERKHAAGLMRINHTGEVCAQALYYGQSLTAREEHTREHLLAAADEEGDHLAWCEQRLGELEARPSRFNALWYLGSFSIGATAGAAGDAWSFGFVSETERQVEAHLHDHMKTLPEGDHRSRAIIARMAEDEARHGLEAREAGGRELPLPIRTAMRITADLMKFVAYRW